MAFPTLPGASLLALASAPPLPRLLLWTGCGNSRSQYRGQPAGHCYSRPPSGSLSLLWHHAIRDRVTKDDKWRLVGGQRRNREWPEGDLKFYPLPRKENWSHFAEAVRLLLSDNNLSMQLKALLIMSQCSHSWKMALLYIKQVWECFPHTIYPWQIDFNVESEEHIDTFSFLSFE